MVWWGRIQWKGRQFGFAWCLQHATTSIPTSRKESIMPLPIISVPFIHCLSNFRDACLLYKLYMCLRHEHIWNISRWTLRNRNLLKVLPIKYPIECLHISNFSQYVLKSYWIMGYSITLSPFEMKVKHGRCLSPTCWNQEAW